MSADETRFQFGKNWKAFLDVLDDDRIRSAQDSLSRMLGSVDLTGKTFLDIGSGSGLMSLAAYRMGATVESFDYDVDSVECTRYLRERYAPGTDRWTVLQGSVLDPGFMQSRGTHDIVYSWGVLHHTGDMWRAMELASERVAAGGLLYIAIYNDQGDWSRRWWRIKKAYCESRIARGAIIGTAIPYWVLRSMAADLFWLRHPLRRYRDYRGNRGMSVMHDWLDWLGGFPFEVARPQEILDFLLHRGFHLVRLTTAGGSVGCNEFVARAGARVLPAAPGSRA